MKSKFIYLLIFIALIIFMISYLLPLNVDIDQKLFLTISTFFFTIFNGFFITRQGARYSAIRDKLTSFDGNLSFIYRISQYFGKDKQSEIGEIIKKHYLPVFDKSWDWPLVNKTTTITDLANLIPNLYDEKNWNPIKTYAVSNMITALRENQTVRKNLIALREEALPKQQWVLIYLLTIMVLFALFLIPSVNLLFLSVTKAIFGTIAIAVTIILNKMDDLSFFEGQIGEHSAKDVLDLIEGNK